MRKRIPRGESVFGALFLAFLVSVAWIILDQRDNFNPADRDISIETLREQSVEDTLYEAPLVAWSEPGAAASPDRAANLGIFPPVVIADGWTVDGRVEVYDPSNVYEKINGAAEQYIKFGFQKLHYLSISRGEHLISIEIYDQGEFQNTLGIFAAQRSKNREVDSLGDLFFYETAIGAVGGFEQYYFKIAGNSEAQAIRDKAKVILQAMTELPVESSTAPPVFRIMSVQLSIPFDDISYEKTDAFQYAFADDVWFGKPVPDAQWRLFIHQADDADQAKAFYDQLALEQGYEYSMVEKAENAVVLQHDYLKTIFALRIDGFFVFGVTDSPDIATARTWLSSTAESIAVATNAQREGM